jgi:putative sterol carrier protein
MDTEEKKLIFEKIQDAFRSERASGVQAIIQVRLEGDETEDYALRIADQKISVNRELVENPRLTLLTNENDFWKIFSGELDPMAAFFQGRIQVQGDMGFAMKLPGLFSPRF